jgi:hypothetical protein
LPEDNLILQFRFLYLFKKIMKARLSVWQVKLKTAAMNGKLSYLLLLLLVDIRRECDFWRSIM